MDDGERRLQILRQRGLLLGLALALAGTVVNKALGRALLGRELVILGAGVALAAVWRPRWLSPIARLLGARPPAHGDRGDRDGDRS